jgi:Xaa-Pro aminopeptidase
MNDSALKNRQKKVREGMSRAGADCLIVTRPANVTYITGFLGEDSWAIVLPKAVILITDGRYSEQAAMECKNCRIVVRKDLMIKTVVKLLRKLKGNIALEKSASIADLEGLKKELKRGSTSLAAGRVKPVANIIEAVRQIKDDDEIAAIKAAAGIAGQALKNTIRRIRTGMTENALAGMLDFEIRKLAGRSGFETIIAFGPNAARPHHRPTGRKLRKNDTILIDFGVRYKGYNCDITRCFATDGKGRIVIPAKAGIQLFKKVYNAVSEAQAAAIKIVKAGAKIKNVDLAARSVLEKYKLPVYGHGTGHGIGLEIHEAPSISPNPGAPGEGVLQAGEVVTIEPGVYLSGKFAVRIEDDILVTKHGVVILDKIPK